MTERYFVDAKGIYQRAVVDAPEGWVSPAGLIEVPVAPEDATQVWDFQAEEWGALQKTREAISREAEEIIARGILVNGAPFKADPLSIDRIERFIAGFDRGAVPKDGVTFATSAGNSITLKTKADAEAIWLAQARLEASTLGASAAMQSGLDVAWPEPTNVTIGEG